jgi:hypothetical protein
MIMPEAPASAALDTFDTNIQFPLITNAIQEPEIEIDGNGEHPSIKLLVWSEENLIIGVPCRVRQRIFIKQTKTSVALPNVL